MTEQQTNPNNITLDQIFQHLITAKYESHEGERLLRLIEKRCRNDEWNASFIQLQITIVSSRFFSLRLDLNKIQHMDPQDPERPGLEEQIEVRKESLMSELEELVEMLEKVGVDCRSFREHPALLLGTETKE